MSGPYSSERLPDGYSLHASKTAADPDFNQLLIVADDRLASPESSPRMMTIIDGIDQADWGGELRTRLQTVADLKSEGLARPLDFGVSDTTGQLWFVSDNYGDSLQSHFEQFPDTGLSDDDAWHVFNSILRGLCDLHDAGLAHENLHPGNVIYSLPPSGELGSKTEIRIGGATTGPRPRWRKQKRPVDQRIFVCSVRDDQRTPSAEQCDLYALGIIGCMLLLGPEPVRKAGETAIKDKDTVWSALRSELREKVSISRMSLKNNRWAILRRLLSRDPAQQLAHALAAREEIPTNYRQKRRMLTAVVAAVLVVACGLAYLKDSASNRVEHETTVASLEATMSDLKRKNEGLKRKNEGLTRSPGPGRVGEVGPNGGPTGPGGVIVGPGGTEGHGEPELSAEAFWKTHRPSPNAEGVVTPLALLKAIADAKTNPKKVSPDILKTKFGRQTMGDLKKIKIHKPVPWFEDWKPKAPRDQKVRKLWAKVVQEPWDADHRKNLMNRMDVLDNATSQWLKWARNNKMTWGQLTAECNKLPPSKENIRDVLREWIHLFENKKSWKLLLVRGQSALGKDWGTKRTFTVYHWGQFNPTAIGSLPAHPWESHKHHKYSPKDGSMTVGWKPGMPITALLEGPKSYGIKPNMINRERFGPLSLWYVHYIGGCYSPDSKVAIFFRIEACPGPPQKKVWECKDERNPEIIEIIKVHGGLPKINK